MTIAITVGVCVRNGEKMLPDALISIQNQTLPPEQIQLIIVDDGSQDRTPQIIKQYLPSFGPQAKFFQNPWRGLGSARNLIVNQADGEYILFVDADQILTSTYIQTQIETLKQKPQAGITAGIFKSVPTNPILNLEVAPYIVNQRNYWQPKNFIWKSDKLVGTGGTTFRTKAIRQVNGFDESITGAGEDTDLILRIRKAGWLFIPNTAELYELHSGLSKPKDLWRKYYWYGYGCQKNYIKNHGVFSLSRMSPLAGFVSGVFYSFPAYKFLYQKQVFLLPLHFGFKHIAWTFGFIKGQLQK